MNTETALARMAALCSVSEHCESDIHLRLERAGLQASDIQAVIDRLYAEGYLDTARYCRAYASDQMRFARWGPVKIAAALRQRGLPAADIDEALAVLPSEEMEACLRHLLASKMRQTATPMREKLLRFAASRGFTYDMACRAVDDVLCQ